MSNALGASRWDDSATCDEGWWQSLTAKPDAEVGASRRPDRRARIAKILVTLGALVVLALHLGVPDLGLDSIALILLGIAVVPWLDVIFESIDTPLGGVKYRTLEERLDELTGESASLRQVQGAYEARERVEAEESASEIPASERLDALAAEYNTLRDPQRGMPSGAQRTAAMTKLVGQMIAAADAGARLDIGRALLGGDLGARLAAYAVLYARPDATYAIPLIDSVIELEPKPFGQFWGLRAVARLIEASGPQVVDLNTGRRLKEFQKNLPAASDRAFELRRILEQLDMS